MLRLRSFSSQSLRPIPGFSSSSSSSSYLLILLLLLLKQTRQEGGEKRGNTNMLLTGQDRGLANSIIRRLGVMVVFEFEFVCYLNNMVCDNCKDLL